MLDPFISISKHRQPVENTNCKKFISHTDKFGGLKSIQLLCQAILKIQVDKHNEQSAEKYGTVLFSLVFCMSRTLPECTYCFCGAAV